MQTLTITDLPMHPLVVHAAVVLVPLSVLLLLVAASVRRTRVQVGAIAAVLAAAGAVAFIVSHRSGTALAEQVGTPYEHMAWADPALATALTYTALCLAWYGAVLFRRSKVPAQAHHAGETPGSPRRKRARAVTVERGIRGLAIAAGLVAVVLTVLVGHSGAEAVWSSGALEPLRP